MKNLSTPSKFQPFRAAKLKRTSNTVAEETRDNSSKKRSKRNKISEGTTNFEGGNTTGLAILPDELLLKILSYYPDGILELHEPNMMEANAHFARRERLIALSQTCRNLRRFFRPYVWRRIEVFTGMCVSAGEVLNTEKQLAVELIRQLEVVTIRDPTLAEYVNIVNVEIGNHCVRAVLLELTRCLTIFPNVNTLKLNHSQLTVDLDRAITSWLRSDNLFPQIRSLIVPEAFYSVLKYCPGVRYMHTIAVGSLSALSKYGASMLSNYCPHLENICVNFATTLLPLLVQVFPGIKDITIYFMEGWEFPSAKIFEELDFIISNFHHLKIITLYIPLCMEWATKERIELHVEETLLSLHKKDKKERKIIVRFSYHAKKIVILPQPPLFAL